jgi:hypothetical protein
MVAKTKTIPLPASAGKFIRKAGENGTAAGHNTVKVPVIVRVDPDLLMRIDREARRLGLSRSAFFVSAAADRLT